MLKSLIFSLADLWGFLTKPHFCQFMTETQGPARRRTLFETLSGVVNAADDDHGKMDEGLTPFTPVPYEAVFRQHLGTLGSSLPWILESNRVLLGPFMDDIPIDQLAAYIKGVGILLGDDDSACCVITDEDIVSLLESRDDAGTPTDDYQLLRARVGKSDKISFYVLLPLSRNIIFTIEGSGEPRQLSPGRFCRVFPSVMVLKNFRPKLSDAGAPGLAQLPSRDLMLQAVPSGFNPDQSHVAAVLRGFPSDPRGYLLSALVHLIREMIHSRCRDNNIALPVAPVLTQITPVLPGNKIGLAELVLLLYLPPGTTTEVAESFQTMAELQSHRATRITVNSIFQFIAATTIPLVMDPSSLSLLSNTPPLRMILTGIPRGRPLSAVLQILWRDQSFKPDWFDKHVVCILERGALNQRGVDRGLFPPKAVENFRTDRLNLFISASTASPIVPGSHLNRFLLLEHFEAQLLLTKPAAPWKELFRDYSLPEVKLPSNRKGAGSNRSRSQGRAESSSDRARRKAFNLLQQFQLDVDQAPLLPHPQPRAGSCFQTFAFLVSAPLCTQGARLIVLFGADDLLASPASYFTLLHCQSLNYGLLSLGPGQSCSLVLVGFDAWWVGLVLSKHHWAWFLTSVHTLLKSNIRLSSFTLRDSLATALVPCILCYPALYCGPAPQSHLVSCLIGYHRCYSAHLSALRGGGPRRLRSCASSQSSTSSVLDHTPPPVRNLSDIRFISGLSSSLSVGVAPTLLEFQGDGLFACTDIHFPTRSASRVLSWRLEDLVICSYEGLWLPRATAESSQYRSNYCHRVDADWVVDAQDPFSCYGRYINEHFDESRVNCRIVLLRRFRRLVVVAIPGILIRRGEELYTSYGLPYWRDLVLTLSPSSRAALLHRYADEVTDAFLSEVGITRNGSLCLSSPNILDYTIIQPLSQSSRAIYFLDSSSIPLDPGWSLVLLEMDFRTRCSIPDGCSLLEARSILRSYFEVTPLFTLEISSPTEFYYACDPDGSCGIQLALLYLLTSGVSWPPSFEQCTASDKSFLRFRRRQDDHDRVIATVSQLIQLCSSPALREKLALWAQGLSQGTRSPLLRHGDLYYLSLEEMCSLLPDGLPASLYVPTADMSPSPPRKRPAGRRFRLCFDRRLPHRSPAFSIADLRHILLSPARQAALAHSHFYPIFSPGGDAAALSVAVDRFLETFLPESMFLVPSHGVPAAPQPSTLSPLSSGASDLFSLQSFEPQFIPDPVFRLCLSQDAHSDSGDDTASDHFIDVDAMDASPSVQAGSLDGLSPKSPDSTFAPLDPPVPGVHPQLAVPSLVPSGSLLSLPGRALTLADFPSPTSVDDSDIHSNSSAAPPRRVSSVVPPPCAAVLPSVPLPGPLPPIGLWLSPEQRRYTGSQWSQLLCPTPAGTTRLGLAELTSTGGPQSLLTAFLGTLGSPTETVLTLWKRLDDFLSSSWMREWCLPTELVNDQNIRTISVSPRTGVSLARISGLSLPRIPSLLELYQRRCQPRVHPVLFYLLAGMYCGPIRVIDLVTNTVTWYLVDILSSLTRPRPRRPAITLFDHRGYICGSCPLVLGPLCSAPPEAALTPYHPSLDPMLLPPLEREILGAPSLDSLLLQVPDLFDFDQGGISSVEDFRVLYFNVNGMDGFKLTELLTVMLLHSVDVLVLIDARIDNTLHRVFLTEIHTKLGQRSKLLSSFPSIPGPARPRVGGNAFVINERWSQRFVEHSSDPSQLCLVDSITLKLSSGTLRLLATYWPYPPQVQQDETGLKLFTLTQQFLSSRDGTQSPLEYVHQAISAVTTQHMSHPGNHVILGGDFNSTWRGRKLDGGGYAPPLRRWTRDGGWRSWRDDLPDICPPVTRPSSRLTSGCEIDHVFTMSSFLRFSSYNVGIGSGWVGLSDHRPLLVSYAITTDRLLVPRFSPLRSDHRLMNLRVFSPSKPQLAAYQTAMLAHPLLPSGSLDSTQASQQLQSLTNATLQAAPVKRKKPPRDRMKEYWSPLYAAYQAQLKALLKIQQHLGIVSSRHPIIPWTTPLAHYAGISAIVAEWVSVVDHLAWDKGPPDALWACGFSPEEWRTQDFSNRHSLVQAAVRDFGLVRNALHCRKRKELAALTSEYVRIREENALKGRLRISIQSLLGEHPGSSSLDGLDFGTALPTTPEEVHALITDHFRRHFQSSSSVADDLHSGDLTWESFNAETFEDFQRRHSALGIPISPDPSQDLLRNLWSALRSCPSRQLVHDELQPLLHSAPSFDEFQLAIRSKRGHSAGGPSGLLYDHLKHWPLSVQQEAYRCLTTLWLDRTIPASWLWKWLVPIPKSSSQKVSDLRPIMLMEVLRKIWTGLIVRRILGALLKHRVLCPSQHAYLPSRGTDTANIQLLNTLEDSWSRRSSLYGSSWDMSKAFDSVSRPLIILCWQRLGVPVELAQWLVALDLGGHAIIRSDFALDLLDQQGLEALLPHSFTPERGTGQGDIHSPFTWLAVFDVLLTMLAADTDSSDHIYLPKSDGTLYRARDVCYADDLQSQARTLRGLQRMADLVSVYALVFNLSIAFKKLRVFHYCGISPPSVEFLVLHLAGWREQSVPIRTSGTFRSLGVDYPINPSDATSFESSYQRLRTSLHILARKRASPGLITQVMTTCLLSRGAYVGVLSSWSLAQCRSLDKLFARAYRSRTRNISSSQEENLFQPASVGGLGFDRPSVLIQERKLNLARRAACSDDCYTRFAIAALQRRGHPYPYNVQQPCVSLDRPRSGFWISSLIEYGDSASATLICQLTPPSADLSPTTPIFGEPHLVWTPQQSSYFKQHDCHILLDLAQWNAELSSWRWQELPDFFQPVLGGLLIWQPCPIPLLPGRAWHVTHGEFLRTSSWLIEILSISPRPLSSLVDIVFRKWQLPNPMTTPIVGTLLSNNPRIEVYSGPPDPAVWRSVIFPAGNVAHCVSLEVAARFSSTSTPSHLGNCPPKVRIVSSVPSILPSCLDCPIGANALDGTPSKLCSDVSIYIALHTHPIDSALHVAVKASRVLRCLSILSTCDHKRWSASLYFDASSSHHDVHTEHSTLLAGVLRALYLYEHCYEGGSVSIFVPSKTLVQSILCPPVSHASSVLADLHRMIQQHLSADVLISYAAVPSLLTEPASLHIDQRGMQLSSAYANSTDSLAEVLSTYSPDYTEDSFTSQSISVCVPLPFCCGHWSWRDQLTSSYLLTTVPNKRALLARLAAQSSRDLDRQRRGDPPKWSDVTLQFASSVLGLPRLPLSTRAYYERHLFERHWSVGHNRSKQARTDADRKLLGSCKLCCTDIRQEHESYDHIFRLCPAPLLCAARSASDQQLSEYPLSTSLDARLIPKMIQLLHDEQGHRLGLGNWMSCQLSALESVLLPDDRAEDIRQSILQFSSHLTDRNDAIWAAWHEASYLHAVAASPSGDALHIPRRRHFRPRSRLPGKIRYYAVRVGRETGIFPSWKDARRHVDGFSRPEYGSFKTREAAEAFLSATPVVPQSPLPGPSYSLFTDGSASTSPPFAAGWGLHILDPTGCVTHEDWGPVCLDPSSPEFVGASRYTNNSGELTALISAFKWICALPSHSPLQLNLYTDSDYAQKHLLFSKTLPSANKGLITEARRFLDQARSVHSLSLVWTKAHTKKISMVASGNRKADSLALLGRRELARSLAPVDLLVPRRPLKRRSSVVSVANMSAPSKRARLDLLSSSLSPSFPTPDLLPCLRPPPGGDIVAD